MPRFFFDMDDGENAVRDETGVYLDGPETARRAGWKGFPEFPVSPPCPCILRVLLPPSTSSRMGVDVRTGTGDEGDPPERAGVWVKERLLANPEDAGLICPTDLLWERPRRSSPDETDAAVMRPRRAWNAMLGPRSGACTGVKLHHRSARSGCDLRFQLGHPTSHRRRSSGQLGREPRRISGYRPLGGIPCSSPGSGKQATSGRSDAALWGT